jgi:hypothetical protein
MIALEIEQRLWSFGSWQGLQSRATNGNQSRANKLIISTFTGRARSFPSPAPILSMPCRCRQFSFRRTRLRLCRQEFPSYKYQDYKAHRAPRLLHSPTAHAWLTRHSCTISNEKVTVKRRNPPRPGSTLVRIFRHEKISDVISNARSDDDRHRGFQ